MGDDANSFLHNPVVCILKTDSEPGSLEVPDPIQIPFLHLTALYLNLVHRLKAQNLVSFSMVRRTSVGVFCVSTELNEFGEAWTRLIFN